MATTTTNFGWDIPQSTDLVKDGATAIAALGQDIDTALVDLKGGTTGQILSKASNTDLDYTWINNDQGDITGLTAGIGITITDPTGPVPTITNSSTDLITTAGDLLYGTAADTVARLGIGTAGQVLKVNSGATAPEWGSATAAFSGCSLYNTGNQTFNHNTTLILAWNAENFDTNSYHDNVTNNSRITVPNAGYYLFNLFVTTTSSNQGTVQAYLRKNNATNWAYYQENMNQNNTQDFSIAFSTVLNLAANDYVEARMYQTGGSTETIYGTQDEIYFDCIYLGA